MLILTTLTALALPNVDTPVRLGASRPADAAVVVGIEDYAFLPDVPFAERDAWAVADTLTLSMGLDRNKVTVLTDTPSRERILRAVSEAAEQAGADGTVWVYFAGHGAADPYSGKRVLLGVDAQSDEETFAARGLAVDELSATAADEGADVFLLLDTCFTGRGRTGDDLVPGARMVIPVAMGRPSGVSEWSATQPSQWASPLASAEHGAFTYAVLGALRGWADGYLDGEPDGVVTTDEAHAYVDRALRDLDVRDQSPTFAGSSRTLVSGNRLEAAPELRATRVVTTPDRPPLDPPPSSGPVRRGSIPVMAAGGALTALGTATGLVSFIAAKSNPSITQDGAATLRTVNAVGWSAAGVGIATTAVGFAIAPGQATTAPTLSLRGRF